MTFSLILMLCIVPFLRAEDPPAKPEQKAEQKAEEKKPEEQKPEQRQGRGRGKRDEKPITDGGELKQEYQQVISIKVKLRYLLALPEGYAADPNKQWPLVVFLHGSGERGHEVEKVAIHGPPKLVERGHKFPFILVSPQCPMDHQWFHHTESLMGLIDDLSAKYRVDQDRIYLTGLSMGGTGVIALAGAYPQRFAAILSMCGKPDPKLAPQIKDIPTWILHGAKDEGEPVKSSTDMVDAIKAAGGNPKFTLYPEGKHNIWTVTYDNPEVYEWMLAQKRPAHQAQPSPTYQTQPVWQYQYRKHRRRW